MSDPGEPTLDEDAAEGAGEGEERPAAGDSDRPVVRVSDHPRAGATDPTVPARASGALSSAVIERALGDAPLPARYQATGYLGGGGMGQVLRALDRELGREVAIKSLAPALRHAQGLERLQREARAIAALRHPGIVGVYDIDVEAGILVMELLPGGSIADLIQREGRLEAARSIEIVRGVLEALAAVHEAGIIHRDVKPSNILLDERGQPKLCDFGVVHTLDSEITQDGTQPGTPAYMAPEQLHRGRSDERSDVYSAGVTLFEMLTARRFKNEPSRSAEDLLAVLQGEGVTPWLARVVVKAVEEAPEERHPSARAMLAALDGRAARPGRRRLLLGAVAAAGVAVAAAAVVVAVSPDAEEAAAASPGVPRPGVVAFLPFDDRTGDPALEFTAHGVPRVLGAALSRAVPSTRVVDYDALRDLVPPDERASRPWIEAARDREAEVVVEGAIEARGGDVLLTSRLLQVEGETAEELDQIIVRGRAADLDALMSSAASQMAERLFGETPPPSRRPPHTLDALRDYQRGVDALRRARFDEAIEALEAVVALDPSWADAWYHLSIARTWSGGVGQRDAFRAIDRALALVEGRREQALLRAMRLLTEQRPAETAELLEPLRDEYPRDRDLLYTLGEGYHHGGDVAAGLLAFRASLQVSPGFLPSTIHPSRVYLARRDERQLRELSALRRRFGQEEQAEMDEWLLEFAMRRYEAILARPLPEEPGLARRAAMLAHLASLLVLGQDARAAELLKTELVDVRHTVIHWGSETVLAAMAYRRGAPVEARRWAGEAAVRASAHDTAYYRGEARAALGIVRAMAGDLSGTRAELAAVDAEQYGPNVPRTVLAFRAVAAAALGDPALLTDVLAAPERDIRMLAEGLRHEMRRDHPQAAATLALALDEPTEGYFDIVILDALARNRAALGDTAGLRAACNELERPAVYHPYREPALTHCQ